MRRAGRTKTLTISVDVAAEKFVRKEADRLYGGNVSQLFAALLREAERFAAMDRVIASSGHARPTDAELDALRTEVAGKPPKRKRRAA
jgi:hypothetical protein